MKKLFALSALGLAACSSTDITSPPSDSGTHDTSVADSSAQDAGASGDSSPPVDSGSGDGGCPSSWTVAPVVDAPIALPDGGGGVLLHASAAGTQDYTCTQSTVDGGTAFTWVFTGPEADLADCKAVKIGTHEASDAGPTAPEWVTTIDGTYVIGKKLAAETPDGGESAIPWLLLQATTHGGSGPLSRAGYVQRVNTTGGLAPSAATCGASSVGTSQKVTYTADYYFFGQ